MWKLLLDSHLGLAFALWVGSGAMAGAWWFGVKKNSRTPVKVWQFQGILQVAVLIQAALGVALWETGPHPQDRLHFLYGVVLALIVLVERSLLPQGRLRAVLEMDWGRFSERWTFFSLNLLSWLLVGRAITTGIWGF
ncbi:MAG: hypothetical protein K6U87_08670 [Firmicutes bacterium]|nr:hypothetical protein [Bacillota bacterium]